LASSLPFFFRLVFVSGSERVCVCSTFCLMSRTRRSSDVPAAVVGRTLTPPPPPPAPPVPLPPPARSNFTLSKLISEEGGGGGALRLPKRGCPHPLNT
jgi:hypothetical protein